MRTKEEILQLIRVEELERDKAFVRRSIKKVEDRIKKLLEMGNPTRLPIYFGDYKLPLEADPKQSLLVPIYGTTKVKEALSSAKYVFEEGKSLDRLLDLIIVDLS